MLTVRVDVVVDLSEELEGSMEVWYAKYLELDADGASSLFGDCSDLIEPVLVAIGAQKDEVQSVYSQAVRESTQLWDFIAQEVRIFAQSGGLSFQNYTHLDREQVKELSIVEVNVLEAEEAA
jgi:hypothetical protein